MSRGYTVYRDHVEADAPLLAQYVLPGEVGRSHTLRHALRPNDLRVSFCGIDIRDDSTGWPIGPLWRIDSTLQPSEVTICQPCDETVRGKRLDPGHETVRSLPLKEGPSA